MHNWGKITLLVVFSISVPLLCNAYIYVSHVHKTLSWKYCRFSAFKWASIWNTKYVRDNSKEVLAKFKMKNWRDGILVSQINGYNRWRTQAAKISQDHLVLQTLYWMLKALTFTTTNNIISHFSYFFLWIVRKHFHNEILLPYRYYMCFDGHGIFWHNSFSRTIYTGASCQKDLIHKDLRPKSWVLLWLKKWHLTGFCQGIFWSGIYIVLVGTTWLRG